MKVGFARGSLRSRSGQEAAPMWQALCGQGGLWSQAGGLHEQSLQGLGSAVPTLARLLAFSLELSRLSWVLSMKTCILSN